MSKLSPSARFQDVMGIYDRLKKYHEVCAYGVVIFP